MRIATAVSLMMLMLAVWGCSDSDDSTSAGGEPATPAGLAASDVGFTNMTLSWDDCDNVTAYDLYRAVSGSGNYTKVYSGPSTMYLDNDLLYATSYSYQVSAENSSGESPRSTPVVESTDVPNGFTVSGSPSGAVDHTFLYLDMFNAKPRYQSVPAGLMIAYVTVGPQAGHWVFSDTIEQINRFYHPEAVASDYPPPTGWRAVTGDTETNILLTPF